MKIAPEEIIASFHPYRPSEYSAETAAANLRAKIKDKAFVSDLEPLVGRWPDGYDIESAADLVSTELLSRL